MRSSSRTVLDQSLRRAAQHLIADDVAVVVVDEFEVVEIEDGDGDRPLSCVREGCGQTLRHRQTVREAGERVVTQLGLEGQLAVAQLADKRLALACGRILAHDQRARHQHRREDLPLRDALAVEHGVQRDHGAGNHRQERDDLETAADLQLPRGRCLGAKRRQRGGDQEQ